MNIPCPVQKGRPREFCVDQALTAALRVFWSKGYEGASLTDLTEAMGITRPSLYAAFGNKEALFKKAFDLYERDKLAYVREALDAPTAREVAERLLNGSLAMLTGDGSARGCLSVISSMPCGAEAESVRSEVLARRAVINRAIVDRLERAKEEGDLPSAVDPEGLSRMLAAMFQGLSIQHADGATKAQLQQLIDTSLALWPTAK
ncbi:MAG TPA: TetR/AcrR family transcriptional regulator [Allosphingosinicella sp.]|nr:TetR/AcrR family transcriptional regulator [Allosphingosinicella sp.]